ncbi:MAG TPA: ABC transporter substrate-binding protein [Tepidisphaeraceae bacterium]
MRVRQPTSNTTPLRRAFHEPGKRRVKSLAVCVRPQRFATSADWAYNAPTSSRYELVPDRNPLWREKIMKRRNALGLGPAALLALHAANSLPLAFARGEGGTFVFGRGGDSVKLDPAVVTDGESFRVTDQIFDRLIGFDGSTTNIKPALAKNWDISPDGLTYTFHLRDGVTFHDGTPFDAAAVKWNFDRWGDEENPYRNASDTFEYYEDVAGFSDAIKSVDVVDPLTLQITLNAPQGPFLLNLALPAFGIASPTAMMADIQNAYKNPVGTGAFKFGEWVPGDHITLAKNAAYWGDTPLLDSAIVRTIPDNAARFLALRSGSIDMMEGANPDDVTTAGRDRNLQVLLRPSLNIAYINMNLRQAPFDKLQVRQAVAAAINRSAIVEALYAGIGKVAAQLIPPTMLGFNPDVKGPSYDPDRAKKLLADAGLPNGFTTDFWYMPLSRPYYPDPKSIAQAFAADLAKVGITANLKTEDWDTYLQDRNALKFPIWMLGWTGDNGDPDNFLYTFFGALNAPGKAVDNSWDNAQVRTLLLQAQNSSDVGERDAIYRQVNQIINDEVPRIPIAHTTPPLLARSYVRGYVTNPTATEPYMPVWLDK